MSLAVQLALIIALAALAQAWKGRTGLFWFIGLGVWFFIVNAVVATALAQDPRFGNLPSSARLAAVEQDGMAPVLASIVAGVTSLIAVVSLPKRKKG